MQKNLQDHFRRQERNVQEVLGMIVVTDGFGKVVARHNAIELGVEWFTIGTDAFFNMHGFSWVPKGTVYEIARRKTNKVLQEVKEDARFWQTRR